LRHGGYARQQSLRARLIQEGKHHATGAEKKGCKESLIRKEVLSFSKVGSGMVGGGGRDRLEKKEGNKGARRSKSDSSFREEA